MYLMIDHYDSFVYNLVCYMRECGAEVEIVRSGDADLVQIEALARSGALEGIVISPGPKGPDDCPLSQELVRRMAGQIPILGVCLGHQIIGRVFGAAVQRGQRPMHGKISLIHNSRQGLFRGLPAFYRVTRYHSLVVSEQNLPNELEVDARTGDGVIMGFHHKELPIFGVQFHPEAVLTEYGHELLYNFIQISREISGRKASGKYAQAAIADNAGKASGAEKEEIRS
ncbi:aminodeoxychorismate/anthranilate synthase component II [Hornefia porci]|uniref:Aminodeoxychorismate/anthranilate synthase component II n=1 Tax=Hornefia porci TaxID=2652292 RepID=A0A1Q9JJA0_9FIRM|nr:aminodeoxychorismate/anthranilate synthase component II [Hornefia porci]OLR56289.1 aminodeoxychorismate/anthranilate synthase component II [Hornefia porci]